MSEYTPGIYRGGSAGCFGLWRLTPGGRWLFSVPVEGDTWRRSGGPGPYRLVLIAADDDTGTASPRCTHDDFTCRNVGNGVVRHICNDCGETKDLEMGTES